jgi:hypothetical protein
LIKLHHVKAGTVPLKRLNDALNVCLSLRDVFGPLALRDALDRMTPPQNSGADGLASVPKAFLRTCILAVKMHPAQLAGPVAQRVLPRLVEVGVWKDADLWKGFLMYCTVWKSTSELDYKQADNVDGVRRLKLDFHTGTASSSGPARDPATTRASPRRSCCPRPSCRSC